MQGSITINEGQESVRRFAKEGDIVIKSDGTQEVLKKGPHSILGEGQGVAPDLGVINDDFTVTAKNITNGTFHMQLSADKNWIWNGNSGEWNAAYAQNFSDTILQQVLQANGL